MRETTRKLLPRQRRYSLSAVFFAFFCSSGCSVVLPPVTDSINSLSEAMNPNRPITVRWEHSPISVNRYYLEYSTGKEGSAIRRLTLDKNYREFRINVPKGADTSLFVQMERAAAPCQDADKPGTGPKTRTYRVLPDESEVLAVFEQQNVSPSTMTKQQLASYLDSDLAQSGYRACINGRMNSRLEKGMWMHNLDRFMGKKDAPTDSQIARGLGLLCECWVGSLFSKSDISSEERERAIHQMSGGVIDSLRQSISGREKAMADLSVTGQIVNVLDSCPRCPHFKDKDFDAAYKAVMAGMHSDYR